MTPATVPTTKNEMGIKSFEIPNTPTSEKTIDLVPLNRKTSNANGKNLKNYYK